MNETPRFRVRAAGAFKQLPGCPDYAVNALSPRTGSSACAAASATTRATSATSSRASRWCASGRSAPRASRCRPLIEDPWRRFDCPNDPAGCTVEFEDPDYTVADRDVVYYVRAIQEPTPAVNAGGLRCDYDAAGNCVKVHPCYGDYRTPFDDDCLSENEERAWSSPIYVNQG